MFSLYEQHNVVKRSYNQFEIEAPSPELPRKRIRYTTTNNNNKYTTNYETVTNSNDCKNDEYLISPVLSSLSNNKLSMADDGIQCNSLINNDYPNNNILTPATTPAANTNNTDWLKLGQQQQQQQVHNNNIGSQIHNDNEIYSEAEEYMVMGYFNGYCSNNNNNNNSLSMSSSSTNIQTYNQMTNDNNNENNNQTFHTQYSLYDLTNEEIEMINTQQHRLQDQQMEY
ncbi:hypothetical protein, no similarity [Maudiozyma saulgeensis]|uniref:Uncharacterized protein n=1 Tax=Maudiozyma saulgeensis TaxID=1789683 RepID=A0A1X7R177_9SACH|nr:hypothetical protein, no similarity [Kazachstania saulgeensis]